MGRPVQGGIYNLPSHLSPGARDLIPRMLLVDPLKRITIPEIRCPAPPRPAPPGLTCALAPLPPVLLLGHQLAGQLGQPDCFWIRHWMIHTCVWRTALHNTLCGAQGRLALPPRTKPPPGVHWKLPTSICSQLRVANGSGVGSRSRGRRSRPKCDCFPHRQHPWFTVRLPRYLAVMQADTVASATCVDNEIVSEVRRGPPCAHRMASLRINSGTA